MSGLDLILDDILGSSSILWTYHVSPKSCFAFKFLVAATAIQIGIIYVWQYTWIELNGWRKPRNIHFVDSLDVFAIYILSIIISITWFTVPVWIIKVRYYVRIKNFRGGGEKASFVNFFQTFSIWGSVWIVFVTGFTVPIWVIYISYHIIFDFCWWRDNRKVHFMCPFKVNVIAYLWWIVSFA